MNVGNVISAVLAFLTCLAVTIPMLQRGLNPLPVLHPWLTYYLMTLLCVGITYLLIHALLTFREWRSTLPRPPVRRWSGPLLILTALLGLWTRFDSLSSPSVWYDEDRQMIGCLIHDEIDDELIQRAAFQQQPPLDFALTWQDLCLFDTCELGVRFHAACLGALAVPVFVGFLLRAGAGAVAVTIGSVLFVLSGWLIRYAQEGRPVSLALFLSLIYLHTLLDLFQRPGVRTMLACMATITLFLLSIGFQPCLYVLTLTAVSLPLLIECVNRRFILMHAGAAVGGIVLTLPILSLIFSIAQAPSQHYVRPWSLTGLFQTLFLVPAHDIVSCFHLLGPFTWPFALIALLSVVMAIRHVPVGDGDHSRLFILLALFSLFFPWIFHGVYRGLVSPTLYERHYLTILPVFLIVLSLGAERIIRSIAVCRPGAHKWAAGLILAVMAGMIPAYVKWPAASSFPVVVREDWKGLYATLEATSEPGDVALIFSLGPPEIWTLQGFAATHFYYFDRPLEKRVRLVSEWLRANAWQADIAEQLLASSATTLPTHIFLVIPERWSLTRVPVERFDGNATVEVGRCPLFSYLRISTGGNPWKALDNVLEDIDSAIPDTADQYRLLDMRIACAFNLGEWESAQTQLTRIAAVDGRHLLRDRIRHWRERLSQATQR